MVNIDKIKRGAINYADAEILSKISGGSFKKVIAGAGIALYISNIEKIITENKDNALVAGLGVIHPDGSVDIERLAEAVKKYIPDEGVVINIELLGLEMKLHKNDIDGMLSYILNA
jgi:hypothetical protein